MTDLTSKACAACAGGVSPLSPAEITVLKTELNPDWALDDAGKSLVRKFTLKGFAKAVLTANLAAFISDKEGHHADIAFGWGYCTITLTSHDLGGLSENDFICAAKLDAALV